MILGDVFERFVQDSPVSVMTQALLENALPPSTVDTLFENVAERQYTRDLLFSEGAIPKSGYAAVHLGLAQK
ncbi:MAG: hypothetical protein JO114_21795 [Planctomycetaceae bacterium]|nr:hypothetical protein [Planctomycetaceae bacterium]